MICPKCGFNQPEDIYCARCGVHVKKYRQKQKKRTLTILISVLILIGVLAFFAGRMYLEKEARVTMVQPPSSSLAPQAKPPLVTKRGRNSQQAKRAVVAGHMGEKGGPPVAGPGGGTKTGLQSPQAENSSKKDGNGLIARKKETALTALQWFDRGTALNDDSTTEIACYQKALELDPAFAPAYYRLGAIYFRHAEYEQADQAFSRFLKLATDEQKGLYDIYVFYSPTEVENLAAEESPADSAVASGKGPSDQGKSDSPDQGKNSEKTAEHAKEMQTAIPFESLGYHIIVRVLLNREVTARMLLDTGAGITVLSTSLAEKLNLNAGGAGTVLLKTLTRKVRAPLARVPHLQLGSHTKENFPVAVYAMIPVRDSFEGILGMDFLQGFTITVDAKTNRILLSNAGPPKEDLP
ncbi:MAG: hypothetical protein DRG82_15620 [Deltaproteobacteria bacterium]|nr:MAG: hypothetical protein DRG82_15620 [Deltaproteobacteria bacterium]